MRDDRPGRLRQIILRNFLITRGGLWLNLTCVDNDRSKMHNAYYGLIAWWADKIRFLELNEEAHG